MDFVNFTIKDLIESAERKITNAAVNASYKERSVKNPMGLVDHPDLDKNKHTRFEYGCFQIQPPPGYDKWPQNKRVRFYKDLQDFLGKLYAAVNVISKKGYSSMFLPTAEDKTKTVIRLIDDEDNEYAELYQQEDDDKDNIWEKGDIIWNLGARNDNLHTIVHAFGHQYFYEILSDEAAEEWKDYFDIRKYRKKQEFVTEYAMENHREDFAETFSVLILGRDRINAMYKTPKINKNVNVVIAIVKKLHNLMKANEKNREKNSK